ERAALEPVRRLRGGSAGGDGAVLRDAPLDQRGEVRLEPGIELLDGGEAGTAGEKKPGILEMPLPERFQCLPLPLLLGAAGGIGEREAGIAGLAIGEEV